MVAVADMQIGILKDKGDKIIVRCLFGHKYKEIDRYLMFTGEDYIFLKCERCGKEDYKFSLETYYGKANALPYSEWVKIKIKDNFSME